MADKVVIKAEVREGRGKNDTRRLRTTGRIPVAVYGGGDALALTVELKDIAAILRTEGGIENVFTLDIAGVGSQDVKFQDRQIDSIKGRLLHADLCRVA